MFQDLTKISEIIKGEEFDPRYGLPEELFLYISSIVPMINVDLLVKNEKYETLLSWRDDEYTGKGWHIPGGIIRYKEKIIDRIKKVALSEIGYDIGFKNNPLDINEIIADDKNIRGHFISILYECYLPSSFILKNGDKTETDAGFLKWHKACPDNLLCYHEIYRKYI